MKLFTDFFVNALDIPNDSMVNFILLDSMNQRKQLSGKAEFGVIGSEVIIDDG
jgi:hypothetical protein